MLLQQSPLTDACGEDPSFICQEVFERTDSASWAEAADVVFAKPLTILLIIVVAWLANRLVHRAVRRFVESLTDEKHTSRRIKRRLRRTSLGERLPPSVLATGPVSLRSAARAETIGYVLSSIGTFVIWTIAIITILGELGIDLGPLIAGAGIAGVALGFGAQSLVKDFLAGIFIIIEDQYGVGDIVDLGEAVGEVEAVSLRVTRIRDLQGSVWHVPNGQIMRVSNMSQKWARALLDVTVTYTADIDEAADVIKQVADDLSRDPEWAGRVLEPPEIWGVEALTPDGVTVRLVVKTTPNSQWGMQRELRARIKRALEANGMQVAPPRRVVSVQQDGGEAPKGASSKKAAAREKPSPRKP